jgi:uncharacterized membrane protein YeiH
LVPIIGNKFRLSRLNLGSTESIVFIGGGMTRDVLLAEIPQVLRSDLYAVAALAAASIVVIGHVLGLPYGASALFGAALCLGLRLTAIRRGWHLPGARLSAQARAAKDPSSAEKPR